MKYFFIILSLTFLFSQSSPSDINILSVTIEGNDRFSDQDVLRHIRLYPGMKISGEDIQDIIKRPFITWAVRSSCLNPTILPFFIPIGERTASIITASFIIFFL